MGRFGSLFRKSDDKKSDQAGENPYAQQSPADTYSSQRPSGSSFQSNSSHNNNQYHQNQSGLPSGPRPGGYGRSDLNSAPPPYQSSSASTPSNQKSPAVGYTNDRFGAQSGYGKNRYDNDAQSFQNNAPPQRTGGYGGLGGDNQLFNNYVPPSNRHDAGPQQQQQQLDGLRDEYGNLREMTEEEREEAEVRTKKDEIKGVLRDTEASAQRSAQMVTDGIQRLAAMHEMLDIDGERLNRAEDRIDESLHQSKLASEHLNNLDAANSSMFNFVANGQGRMAERRARMFQADRERELSKQELRRNEQEANKEWEASMQAKPAILGGRAKPDNSKYVFEDSDGEQDQINQNIDQHTAAIERGVDTINMMAKGMHRKLELQNQQISRMDEKASSSGDHLVKNRQRMKTTYGA